MRGLVILCTLTQVLACSDSSSKSKEKAQPTEPTFQWTPDPMADPQALAAHDGVVLREHDALVFVETSGEIRWRRALEKHPEVVVPLKDGRILATTIDGELYVLAANTGSVTTHSLPDRALAGLATDDGALLVTAGGLVQFRDGALDERRRGNGGGADSVALAPNGTVWIGDNNGWTVLDSSGAVLFGFIPEGFEASSSFPPVFIGDKAWMFVWREGRDAEIIATRIDCKPTENEPRHLGHFSTPKRCVVVTAKRPELSRVPTVSTSRDVIVFGHGSGPGARYLEALRDGKRLWRQTFSRLGTPPKVLACGDQVVALTDNGVTRFDLETGKSIRSRVEYALEAVCVEDRPVLVQHNKIVALP